MKILRKGARANHGVKSVELKNPKLKWNSTYDTFELTFPNSASDFTSDARHNYRIRIDAGEMSAILVMIGQESSSLDSEDFVSSFSKAIPSLEKMRLMACGLKVSS
jgi:hypothetical protein